MVSVNDDVKGTDAWKEVEELIGKAISQADQIVTDSCSLGAWASMNGVDFNPAVAKINEEWAKQVDAAVRDSSESACPCEPVDWAAASCRAFARR